MNSQLVAEKGEKEFFLWVDPTDWMVQNNIGLAGGLGCAPPENADPANLMFVFNPNHRQGFVSRFHVGVINSYRVEYYLDQPIRHFSTLPSRLHGMYPFEGLTEAERYRDTHASHISGRILIGFDRRR